MTVILSILLAIFILALAIDISLWIAYKNECGCILGDMGKTVAKDTSTPERVTEALPDETIKLTVPPKNKTTTKTSQKLKAETSQKKTPAKKTSGSSKTKKSGNRTIPQKVTVQNVTKKKPAPKPKQKVISGFSLGVTKSQKK